MFPMPAQLGVRFAPGTMLGRYELLATIGVGGMASVILARQRGPAGFEKAVVIKLIHPHLAQDAVAVNMLLDEAKVAAQLDHQNIVHTYELGEAHGTYYIVMEYLAGESLGQVLKQGQKQDFPMTPFLAAKVVADAAEGLHYAHELADFNGQPIGIVHRDVSPGNIVVQYNGSVKVVDFGIAKAQGRVTSTQDGELKGKYGYMSPEQIKNDMMDRRSDVFSLGVVLWESLARRRLFQADNVAATLMQILTGDRTPPSAFDGEIPHALDAVALRALAPEPGDRFQTVGEMKQAIDDAIWRARVSTADVQQHMVGLFSERMEMRRTLLARATREPLSAGDLEVLGTAFRDPSSGVSRPGSIAPVEEEGSISEPTISRHPQRANELPSERSSQRGYEPPSERSADALPPPPPGPLAQAWAPPLAVGRPLNLPSIAPPPNLPPPTVSRASWSQASEIIRPAPSAPGRAPQGEGERPRSRRTAVILVAGAIVGVALGVLFGVGGGSKDTSKHVEVSPSTEVPAPAAGSAAGSGQTVSEAMATTPMEPRQPTVATVHMAQTEPTVPPDVTADAGTQAAVAPPPTQTPVKPIESPPKPVRPTTKQVETTRPIVTERPTTAKTKPPVEDPDEDGPKKGPAKGSIEELYKRGADAYLAGDFGAAEMAYKQALTLNRSYAPAHRGLGFLYQRTGESAKALQSLRTYLKLTPNAKDGAAIRKRIQQLGGE